MNNTANATHPPTTQQDTTPPIVVTTPIVTPPSTSRFFPFFDCFVFKFHCEFSICVLQQR